MLQVTVNWQRRKIGSAGVDQYLGRAIKGDTLVCSLGTLSG